MSGVTVEAKNVGVAIGKASILHDVNFTIKEGSITGLLGPSGAGKTTLMRAIVGLQNPTHGRLTVLDKKSGDQSLRSRINYMTQNFSIYNDLTVKENLEFFSGLVGSNAETITTLLERLDLTKQKNALVSHISGGQKTRVSLAAALLGKPKLIVLDEPTVGIDPMLRVEIWKLLKYLAKNGITLLVSSHVMDEAKHCDQIILMRDGTILADDSPNNLMRRTKTKDVESAFIAMIQRGEA